MQRPFYVLLRRVLSFFTTEYTEFHRVFFFFTLWYGGHRAFHDRRHGVSQSLFYFVLRSTRSFAEVMKQSGNEVSKVIIYQSVLIQCNLW